MKKVALITGASGGIGKALAIEAARNGYNLGLLARSEDPLKQVAEECKALGADVVHVVGDVSIQEDCHLFVKDCLNRFGSIHVLINNAGISMRAVFNETEPEVLKKLMDINFWGTVYCTKYALPEILKNKGSVVAISSIAGFKGLPGRTGYSASKFAMQGFMESLRCENLETGLHVLIACPGYTASNIRKTALTADGKSQNETPLNEAKLVQPEEVAVDIWKAIHKRKSYLVLTFQGKMAVLINKWWPALADRLTNNVIKKEPDSPFK
jgi:dehydrogenase/reductase SDR family member 7B